jgi:hypothetical protein
MSRSARFNRRLFTEPVDYLIGYDGTPASKWTKAKKDLIISNLFRVNIVRMRQTAPSKLREDSAGGLTFPSCQFLGSQQNIVVDVKCGSHAPDDIASSSLGQCLSAFSV